MTFKKPSKQKKQVKIHTLSFCLTLIGCGLLLGMLLVIRISTKRYETFVAGANDYLQLEAQANLVKTASDYLTEQAHMFVQTLDIQYVEKYFEEANVMKRRESALEALKAFAWSDIWDMQVAEAVQTSEALMVQEMYAMKLASAASGYKESLFPAEIQEIQLSVEDASLTDAQMLEKAREMLFGTQYLLTKKEIYDSLSMFMDGMLLEVESTSADVLKRLDKAVFLLYVMVAFGMVLFVGYFLVVVKLVIHPLEEYTKQIKQKKKMNAARAVELDAVADAYNRRRR